MSVFTKLPAALYPTADKSPFVAFSPGSDFGLSDARAMIWLSQLAYETDDQPKIEQILGSWSLTLVGDVISREAATVLPSARTHAIVAAGHGAVFVAFAGTDPAVLENWLTDFDTRPTSDGSARGYRDAAAVIRDDLADRLDRSGGGSVLITGHSLGGALAVVTALECVSEGTAGGAQRDIAAVYTFGMPRPGSPAFADAYNRRLGARTYRLVHGDDIVPTVAPSWMNFRHVGRYLHCSTLGKFRAEDLTSDTSSDEPGFRRGIATEFRQIAHAPINALREQAEHFGLALDMALGRVPAGTRSDLGGISIELLPPRLRDHMPDRYWGALE
jgi:triacylglycerol lipase